MCSFRQIRVWWGFVVLLFSALESLLFHYCFLITASRAHGQHPGECLASPVQYLSNEGSCDTERRTVLPSRRNYCPYFCMELAPYSGVAKTGIIT